MEKRTMEKKRDFRGLEKNGEKMKERGPKLPTLSL